jgi:hypothetical protein
MGGKSPRSRSGTTRSIRGTHGLAERRHQIDTTGREAEPAAAPAFDRNRPADADHGPPRPDEAILPRRSVGGRRLA